MDGGTYGVREWMAGPAESANVLGEQHRDMGGRPQERNIKWAPKVKAKACPGGGRVPRLGSRDQVRVPASAEGSWVSRSVLLGAALRRVGFGRRLGWPRWILWKTVCMMAGNVSYLAVARPSEGERESQIYFLSPRDFWADDGHGERREGFHLRDPPSSANCFYLSDLRS